MGRSWIVIVPAARANRLPAVSASPDRDVVRPWSSGIPAAGAAHALQFVLGAATTRRTAWAPASCSRTSWSNHRAARPDGIARLSELAGGDAVTRIHALGLQIGLPASLAEIGVERDQLRGMAEAAAGIKRLVDNSPRPLGAEDLEAILDAAWHGDPARLRARGVEVSA